LPEAVDYSKVLLKSNNRIYTPHLLQSSNRRQLQDADREFIATFAPDCVRPYTE